ncbi:MAG: MFS transporter [Rubrivivax sp.]
MTHVYSDLLFDDRLPLAPLAIERHRGVAVTLLTALDLPWTADHGIRDGEHVREPVDDRLRELLLQHALPFASSAAQGRRGWRRPAPRCPGVPALARHAAAASEASATARASSRLFTRLALAPANADTSAARSTRRQWLCDCCVPEAEQALPALGKAGASQRRSRPQPNHASESGRRRCAERCTIGTMMSHAANASPAPMSTVTEGPPQCAPSDRAPSGMAGPFRHLAFANLAAQAAEQISLAAVPIVAVLAFAAGTREVGLLAAAQSLPFLLLALPFGLWADRASRRSMMVAAESMRVVAMALLAALAGFASGQWLSMPALALLGFAGAVGTVAFSVAAPAMVPSLVPREALARANGRLELARSLAFAAGPALAGAVVAAAGGSGALALAAALSLLAVMGLRRLPVDCKPALFAHAARMWPRRVASPVPASAR